LPGLLSHLGDNAFTGCTSLLSIELKGDAFTNFSSTAFAGLEDGGTLILPCINDNEFFITEFSLTEIDNATE